MERDWERSEEFRRLTLEEIADLTGRSPVAAELLAEGKANTNYRLDFANGDHLILRLHHQRPGSASLEKAVADRYSEVARIPKVYEYNAERGYSLVEWRPGRTMERWLADGFIDSVLLAAYDLGMLHARISAIYFDAAGFLDADLRVVQPWSSAGTGYLDYADELLASPRVQERLGPELHNRLVKRVKTHRPAILASQGSPCLVHGDFKASNLLLERGQVTAALDWEFVHSGTYLFGIGQLLRHKDELPEDFAERFGEGFTANGAYLPDDWRELARTIDLVNLLDFLNREGESPVMIEDIRRLVAAD